MVAKRRLDFSKVTDAPMSKRLKRMEYQVYRNRPEMKTATVALTGNITAGALSLMQPCRLGTGTTPAQRIGDKIRLYRIEVRGTGDNRFDQYIIQKKTTTDPTIASFTTASGAYIFDSLNTNQFTEWLHYRNIAAGPNSFSGVKYQKRFKGGIVVKYNGSAATNVVDNEIIVAVVNRSSSSLAYDCTCRIWYTDA